jgi:hypothetical protein
MVAPLYAHADAFNNYHKGTDVQHLSSQRLPNTFLQTSQAYFVLSYAMYTLCDLLVTAACKLILTSSSSLCPDSERGKCSIMKKLKVLCGNKASMMSGDEGYTKNVMSSYYARISADKKNTYLHRTRRSIHFLLTKVEQS